MEILPKGGIKETKSNELKIEKPLSNKAAFLLGLGFRFLGLRHCDGLFVTDFHTAFTTQTLLSVNGLGFVVLHLEDIYGTDFNTFLTPLTFFLVDFYLVSHLVSLP
jgi:hypothetical protein